MADEIKLTAALSRLREHNPHHFLGLHERVIRLWRPNATSIYLQVQGKIVEAKTDRYCRPI